MADYLKTQFLVNYMRETPPESYKLMNSSQNELSSSYESGEKTLQVNENDVVLTSDVTNFYFMAAKPIKLTLSNGTEFLKIQQFAYSSEQPISFSVSNTEQIAVRIIYAAGQKLK